MAVLCRPLVVVLAGTLAAGACAPLGSQGIRTSSAAVRTVASPGARGATPAAAVVPLPNAQGSLKFCVLGDFGTGGTAQYALAREMAALHGRFAFELVALVGDNLYGSEDPDDFRRKFEQPYAPLLDAGVMFYASLGNHDDREQRFYAPFNMNGQLYYSVKAPEQDVRFFALETTYLEPAQVRWLESALEGSSEKWKIVFFHHPLYSSGRTHGSDDQLRAVLEPLFIKHGVSVVFSGHDHIYERVRPQHGITYFVTGSGGKLRPGDVRRGQPFSAVVVDQVNVFLAAEIHDDEMTFNAIDQRGRVVDSGRVARVQQPATMTGQGEAER
ncbi:MAG: metallophosphoesterase [Vicinamibacterales bacterium]